MTTEQRNHDARQEAKNAFEAAIYIGAFTRTEAPEWMYMFKDGRGRLAFKNIITRAYLYV